MEKLLFFITLEATIRFHHVPMPLFCSLGEYNILLLKYEVFKVGSFIPLLHKEIS